MTRAARVLMTSFLSIGLVSAGARGDPSSGPSGAPQEAKGAETPAPAQKSAKKTVRKAKKKGKKAAPVAKENDKGIGLGWLAAHPEQDYRRKAASEVAGPAVEDRLTPPAAVDTVATPAPATPAPVIAAPVTPVPPARPAAPAAAPAAPRPIATRTPADALAARSNSVYRLDPAIDGLVIATGALGSIVPFLAQDKLIRPRGLGNPADLNSLDQGVVGNSNGTLALASNLTTLAALAAPVVIDLADVGWSRELFEDGVVMTEVLSMTGFGVSFAKYTTQRRAPALYLAGNAAAAPNTSLYRSFVSWQTATTFASLSALSYTLNERHDLGALAWVGTALIGGSVALERVASGGAFYTDVIAGAAIGIATGTLIPWLHSNTHYNVLVTPTQNGIHVGGTARF